MVITSWSCWLKTQQARLNTLVNIEPAETLFDGQFSTSANTARPTNGSGQLPHRVIDTRNGPWDGTSTTGAAVPRTGRARCIGCVWRAPTACIPMSSLHSKRGEPRIGSRWRRNKFHPLQDAPVNSDPARSPWQTRHQTARELCRSKLTASPHHSSV